MSRQPRQQSTILEGLLERRDAERERMRKAALVIRAEDAVAESNELGVMRWYLYPGETEACVRNLTLYRYEIPPGERTGKVRMTGNLAAYVLSGAGSVSVNGASHAWEAGDVIGLPSLPEGVEMQFFNSSDVEARIVCAEPNLTDVFGVDGGAGFEILESASTHEPS